MDKKERIIAYSMHRDYFTRTKYAVEHGFFLEALFLEYAAIEGRLEVISGILGCPCNKDLSPDHRRKVNISQRRTCIEKLYKKHPVCTGKNVKLDKAFWKGLGSWIYERNIRMHVSIKTRVNMSRGMQRQRNWLKMEKSTQGCCTMKSSVFVE